MHFFFFPPRFIFIYFREGRGGAEGEGRDNTKQTPLSAEPDVGLRPNPMMQIWRSEPKPEVRMLNRLRHPGALKIMHF